MKAKLLSRALAAVGTAGAMAFSQPLAASPVENPIDTTGATGFVGLSYGDHTVNAALSNALEVDGYTFAGAAGDQLLIQFGSFANGLDPSIVLRDPGGAILKTASCIGGNGRCSTSLDQQITSTGIHTINVSDISADEAGAYQFHIDRYPPVNNWVGFAYGPPFSSEFGHSTDMDFLAFQGNSGTSVRLTIASTTNRLDPFVAIWDPLESPIPNLSCIGGLGRCTASVDLDLAVSGVYKVALRELGADEIGSYNLGVNCLFGNCPSAAPISPAIPEPETYALMLAGLGLIGYAARRRKRA